MKLPNIFLALLAFTLSAPAFSASDATLREDALRLSGFHTMYEIYVSGCEESKSASAAAQEALRAADPQSERLLTVEPPDPNDSCRFPSEQQFLGTLASQVGSDLSTEELRQIIAFLSTPAGRRYLDFYRSSINKGYGAYQDLRRGLLHPIEKSLTQE